MLTERCWSSIDVHRDSVTRTDRPLAIGTGAVSETVDAYDMTTKTADAARLLSTTAEAGILPRCVKRLNPPIVTQHVLRFRRRNIASVTLPRILNNSLTELGPNSPCGSSIYIPAAETKHCSITNHGRTEFSDTSARCGPETRI